MTPQVKDAALALTTAVFPCKASSKGFPPPTMPSIELQIPPRSFLYPSSSFQMKYSVMSRMIQLSLRIKDGWVNEYE